MRSFCAGGCGGCHLSGRDTSAASSAAAGATAPPSAGFLLVFTLVARLRSGRRLRCFGMLENGRGRRGLLLIVSTPAAPASRTATPATPAAPLLFFICLRRPGRLLGRGLLAQRLGLGGNRFFLAPFLLLLGVRLALRFLDRLRARCLHR